MGFAVLAGALLLSGTGCGSRASDQEIVDALRAANGNPAGVVAGPTSVGTATPASPLAGTSVATDANAPASVGAADTSGAANVGSSSTATSAATETGEANGRTEPKPAAAGGTANKSLVKIGTLGVFSGVLGVMTEAVPKTVAAWVTYTNANGGLNGHPVKLIVADDGGDPATSMTLARRLVESDKIIALVSPILVFNFPEIERYTAEKRVPLIGGDNIDPGWATSTNTFPVSAQVAVQTVLGLKMLLRQGGSKIGILYCLEVSKLCQYLTDEVKKSEVGKNVVETYQVSLVAPSYTSQCLRMKQAGIDVIWMAMDTAGAARLVENCATQGFKPKAMLLGINATKSLPTIPALADALLPSAVFPTQATGVPAIEKYREVMATYGSSVGESGAGAFGWASAELLGLVGKNLSDTPTSAELYEALWKVKNETLGGLTVPLTFPKGRPAATKACVFIWGVANGKYSAPEGAEPVC